MQSSVAAVGSAVAVVRSSAAGVYSSVAAVQSAVAVEQSSVVPWSVAVDSAGVQSSVVVGSAARCRSTSEFPMPRHSAEAGRQPVGTAVVLWSVAVELAVAVGQSSVVQSSAAAESAVRAR